jgi:3-carboxy-cis,cis-muconate cycloisomerase
MRAAGGIPELFSPEALVGAMLRFEAALARAEARAGAIPGPAAEAIAAACDSEAFDAAAVWREGEAAGTPAIPLVRRLTESVPAEARGWVHLGATSQDVMDTAMVVQSRAALDALGGDLRGLAGACAGLAERYAAAPGPGRTLLQHAVPVTFGLKAARWLTVVARRARSLARIRDELPLQFGGAAGTLAQLGADGPRVATMLGEELGLPVPDLPWHAERDRIAELGAALGITAGVLAKIAGDIVLLSQTEVGEVAEGAGDGAGASSAMPQKRNPVRAVAAVAAARLALGSVTVLLHAGGQEHERAAGAWQAEWEALPDAFGHTARAMAAVRSSVEGLVVDEDRMRRNLGAAGGAIMAEALVTALVPSLGRDAAYAVVGEVTARSIRDGAALVDAAVQDDRVRGALGEAGVRRALDPAAYLGSAEVLVRRAIEGSRDVVEAAEETLG